MAKREVQRRPAATPVRKTSTTKLRRASSAPAALRRSDSGKSLSRSRSSVSVGAVVINRAPVLTLWMSVCLQRLGHSRDESLQAAKVITGRCAVAKGRALGILPKAKPKAKAKAKESARVVRDESVTVLEIAGMKVPLKPNGASAVDSYIRRSFKDRLGEVEGAMRKLATRIPTEDLRANAMRYYEKFRPAWKGWGVPGELILEDIRSAGD
eukprot:TRINITY_DN32558_c0_g1_i1.p1 TRINITY_DN32558_c0_g1~~TRINITY_DN32558_c0_g1_i1.p1  ORF type:complete len:233 (+),score=26.73 TRINITY_DN32558_c0_g1_i1:68-700(+)